MYFQQIFVSIYDKLHLMKLVELVQTHIIKIFRVANVQCNSKIWLQAKLQNPLFFHYACPIMAIIDQIQLVATQHSIASYQWSLANTLNMLTKFHDIFNFHNLDVFIQPIKAHHINLKKKIGQNFNVWQRLMKSQWNKN